MVQVIQLSDLHDIAVYVSTEALTWLLFKYASLPCLVNLIPISPSEEQNQQLSDRFVLHSGKDLIADLLNMIKGRYDHEITVRTDTVFGTKAAKWRKICGK